MLLIGSLVTVGYLVVLFNVSSAEINNADYIITCPNGSYQIGKEEGTNKPICKLEPTGCPYGDSIPLDQCDKFKPQEKPTVEAPVATQAEPAPKAKTCTDN